MTKRERRSGSLTEAMERLHVTRAVRSRKKPVDTPGTASTTHTSQDTPLAEYKALKTLQLPLWGEDRRGMPNDLARSSLFRVGSKGRTRRFMKDEIIETVGQVVIKYRGEELRQEDQDVYLQLLHLQRFRPLGEVIEFVPRAFLRDLGRSTNSRAYDSLRDTIHRLQATALSLHHPGHKGYAGSLLRFFEWQGADNTPLQQYRVWFEPKIAALFEPNSYTQIQWRQRLMLKSEMAKWLHSFYLTHRNPYPYKLESIRRLSGAATKDMDGFRRIVRRALDELLQIGAIADGYVGANDLVHLVHLPEEAGA